MSGMNPRHVVCQECGRSTAYRSDNTQLQWWLIANRIDGGLVIACPQHISEWRLRVSEVGRTKTTREWAARAKAQDVPPPKPMAEPFPTNNEPLTPEEVRHGN